MQAENFDVNLHDKNLNSFKIQNFELPGIILKRRFEQYIFKNVLKVCRNQVHFGV